MEKGGMQKVFNQMAQYDFTTPMNITTIIEEDSDDKISNINVLKELLHDNNESTHEVLQVNECTRISNDIAVTKSNNIFTNDRISVQVLEVDDEQSRDYFSNTKESTQVCGVATVEVANVNARGTKMSGDNNFPGINDTTELSTIIKNLLDTVSEHLLVIIKHFYDYYYRNRNKSIATDAEFAKQFNNLKHYFYNLSYTTIVSLILPQEQNEKLINKLIDKTVSDANKVFNWKCERKHVEPFLFQMIEWSKKKKDAMKTLVLTHPSNDMILRNPPQQISMPNNSQYTNSAIINHEVVSNTDRNVCLITAGAPGKEVSIHISPHTLVGHHEKQQAAVEAPKKKRRNKRNSPETDQMTTQDNVVSVDYAQPNYYSPNVTIRHRPVPTQPRQPPPPYHNTLPNVVTNNIYNATQRHQNLSRTVQNIQTNQATYLYTPREQQYCSPMEGQTLPIITNVTSWNPMTSPKTGRCCICGQPTTLKCSKCYKFSYCSALCQELDSGTRKTTCC